MGSDKPPSSKSTMGILGAIGFDKGELANKANDVKITVRARDFTKHLLETTNIFSKKWMEHECEFIIYNETLVDPLKNGLVQCHLFLIFIKSLFPQ